MNWREIGMFYALTGAAWLVFGTLPVSEPVKPPCEGPCTVYAYGESVTFPRCSAACRSQKNVIAERYPDGSVMIGVYDDPQ